MTARLATVEGTVDDLRFAVRTTALAGHDVAGRTFDETLLRVRDGVLDTPAGTTAHLPAVYTTFTDGFFERIEASGHESVPAIVNLLDLQVWLGLLPESRHVRLLFDGDPDTGIAETVVIEAEEERITLDGLGDPERLDGVTVEMPRLFEGGRFLLADGTPAPTVVRVPGETLERIVEMVEAAGYGSYPIHVDSDGVIVDIEADGVRVESSLPGTLVEGDAVAADYDRGFPAMAHTLSGKIRIETGAGRPAAFVRDGEGYTLRVVLEGT